MGRIRTHNRRAKRARYPYPDIMEFLAYWSDYADRSLSRPSGWVNYFPGQHVVLIDEPQTPAAPEDSGILHGIRQATTFDGELIRVGGASDDAAMQVQDLEGKIHSGFTAKRSLAKELGGLLWQPVRLSGIGLWSRTEDGIWQIERMQVQSYELLEDEALGLTLERLRSLKVKWPDDADARIAEERGAGL